jgi:hypothetical protein
MDTLPFWQELRSTAMIRGTEWKQTVDTLPGKVSAPEVLKLLQSPEQLALSNIQGVAFLGGEPVYAVPSAAIIAPFLPEGFLTAENLVMQWLFRFAILEGIGRAKGHEPLAHWQPMFLDMYERGLHFMSYTSALLCLLEEGGVPVWKAGPPFAGDEPHEYTLVNGVPAEDFALTEQAVAARVKKATENLVRKAQDYGESFRRHGVPGLIPRLWDKVARYAQLRSEERTPNFESQQDSARDLLGYSVIAWSLVLEIPAVRDGIQKMEVHA